MTSDRARREQHSQPLLRNPVRLPFIVWTPVAVQHALDSTETTMSTEQYSILIFPYLKTSGPVRLGSLVFRSTDDTSELTQEQRAGVESVTAMLYARDDFKIARATYAVVPFIDVEYGRANTEQFVQVQACIMYLYSSPHPALGHPFLSTDHATLHVVSPAEVPSFSLKALHNVVPVDPALSDTDIGEKLPGFMVLYNLRQSIAVGQGSRLYAPVPRPVLNLHQDLHQDVRRATSNGFGLLLRHVVGPQTPSTQRVLTALKWYNSAHSENTDELAAIVHLAIGFEALLGLPHSEKTDRLVDAISLLLGRIPRLDAWADQFYNARSTIVHEGHASELRFAPTPENRKQERNYYQSLKSYGTQVFRLCLNTLLAGADAAEQARLEDSFVTNQERFGQLCRIFDDTTMPPVDRIRRAAPVVDAIDRYLYVGETGLKVETMLAAVRRSAALLHQAAPEVNLDPTLTEALRDMAQAPRSGDSLAPFAALEALAKLWRERGSPGSLAEQTVQRLSTAVWLQSFMYYYWLKEEQGKRQ